MNRKMENAKIDQLCTLIRELKTKISEDSALLARETQKSQTAYNSMISGARRRISVNQIILEQYQRMLKELIAGSD